MTKGTYVCVGVSVLCDCFHVVCVLIASVILFFFVFFLLNGHHFFVLWTFHPNVNQKVGFLFGDTLKTRTETRRSRYFCSNSNEILFLKSILDASESRRSLCFVVFFVFVFVKYANCMLFFLMSVVRH